MKILNKILEKCKKFDVRIAKRSKSDKMKILNFVATSDSDSSYIPSDKLSLSKWLRFFYFVLILFVTSFTFFPLFFPTQEQNELTSKGWLLGLNIFALVILIIDYFLRWATYPTRIKKKSPLLTWMFFPISGVGILMLLSILPTLISIIAIDYDVDNSFFNFFKGFVVLKLLRLVLLLKIVSAFQVLVISFMKQRKILINLFAFVLLLAFLFALIIYAVEDSANDKINNYWDALYFTIITTTTIGYGDISPVTATGKVIVSCEAVLGITMFTIPSGILAASFTYEMQQRYKDNKKHNSGIRKLFDSINKKVDDHLVKENEESLNCIFSIININLDVHHDIKNKLIEYFGSEENIEQYHKENNTHYLFYIQNKNYINNEIFDLARIFNFSISKKEI